MASFTEVFPPKSSTYFEPALIKITFPLKLYHINLFYASVHLLSDNFRCDKDDDDDDNNNNNRLKDLSVSKFREPISELCDVLPGTLLFV